MDLKAALAERMKNDDIRARAASLVVRNGELMLIFGDVGASERLELAINARGITLPKGQKDEEDMGETVREVNSGAPPSEPAQPVAQVTAPPPAVDETAEQVDAAGDSVDAAGETHDGEANIGAEAEQEAADLAESKRTAALPEAAHDPGAPGKTGRRKRQ